MFGEMSTPVSSYESHLILFSQVRRCFPPASIAISPQYNVVAKMVTRCLGSTIVANLNNSLPLNVPVPVGIAVRFPSAFPLLRVPRARMREGPDSTE